MTQDDKQPVRHVHVATCVSKAIGDDGKTAAFQFETPDGEMVFVTVDVGGLTSWRQMAVDAVIDAQRHELNPGSFMFVEPKTFGVQSNPNFRGRVFIGFDPQTPNERVFAIADDGALQLAEQLRKEALSHMTPEQRAREAGKGRLLNSAGIIIPRQ